MFSIEKFVVGLEKVLRNTCIEDIGTHFVLIKNFKHFDREEIEQIKIGELDKRELQEYSQWYSEKATFNGNSLYNGKTYESAIRPQDRDRGIIHRFYDSDMYKVSERGYEISLSKASAYFVYALLCYVGKDETNSFDDDFVHVYRRDRMMEIHKLDELAESMHIQTAKIVTPIEYTQHELNRMMQAYLFNVAYNRDIVFTLTNFKDNNRRRSSTRRAGQLFPYKSYNNELTTYYYQGVSINIPFTQYLAFYHVAEYFFQTIAEQDAFQEIEEFITRPSFSPYRKEDIRVFYNRIKRKMREQKEDGLWDERTGLLLCLKKYVKDLDVLKNTIMAIDSTAIDYYEKEKVPFASEGGIINFSDSQEAVYATIRNRVYSVRNAIVHSKEGEKLRYEPFKHDKELAKEIPLIRAIAEEIIVNSAKKLEFLRFESKKEI